jgi:hypothetical protein
MPTVTAAKELRYAGRTIHAGESFDATDKDARILTRIGKVGPAPVNPTDVPKAEPEAPEVPDDLAAMRAEYSERFGKRPFHGWSPEQLRERMGYNRRDMRAED